MESHASGYRFLKLGNKDSSLFPFLAGTEIELMLTFSPLVGQGGGTTAFEPDWNKGSGQGACLGFSTESNWSCLEDGGVDPVL